MPMEATVWTEEKKQELAELTKQGFSSLQIGERWGLDARTIRNVRGRLGFTLKRSDDWPDSKVELLKTLWAGGKSGSVIAKQLDTTRNAILGKVHRLGLPPRNVVERRIPAVSNRPTTYKKKERQVIPQRVGSVIVFGSGFASDLLPTVADNPCSLIDIPRNGCHWPCEGEGFATVFCGGSAIEGHSYCPRHYRMAYRRGA